MSKKSRKRNKKILAAIGIGLGAAALASRKKASDAQSKISVDSGRGSGLRDTVDTKKADSKMPDNLSKNTGKNNKPAVVAKKPIPGIRVSDDGSITSSKFDKKSPNTTYANKNDYANRKSTVVEPAKKSIADTLSYNSTFAQNQRKNAPVTGTTKPGMKSGGRAGYRSGGKIKKSMGKALRGGGKVMR